MDESWGISYEYRLANGCNVEQSEVETGLKYGKYINDPVSP